MPEVMPKPAQGRVRLGTPGCDEQKKTAPETLNFQGG